MSLENPAIAVVGAGAVGSYYGGRLSQHGFDVHFLLRSDYPAVKARGWTFKSCHGDFTLPKPKVYDRPESMPKADLILITLKTTCNDLYHPLITPLLKEDTIILTLQNGLGNEDQLAGLFGAERVLGGMAFVCINRIEAGLIHHLAFGHIHIGEYRRPATPRLRRVGEIFIQSGIECQILEDLKFGRWEKLLWNIPFNGLGAALDLSTDRLLASQEGTELVRRVMQEVIAIAASDGVKLPEEFIERKIVSTRKMAAYKSSMQIDREVGRPMEIEAIIGDPLRLACRNNIPTPSIETIYTLLRIADLSRDKAAILRGNGGQ